uniref:p0696G06.28 protein n=1 Tax=Oryza sativa subsp. japonica TaxID=39947 RepID=Q8L4P9_ORYSJ|nr:P0696G06.28 [Oryza sativa Japonica Group]
MEQRILPCRSPAVAAPLRRRRRGRSEEKGEASSDGEKGGYRLGEGQPTRWTNGLVIGGYRARNAAHPDRLHLVTMAS